MITIYEYLMITQGWVIDKLKQAGLLSVDYRIPKQPSKAKITFGEAAELMCHDSYRRIGRRVRQRGSGVVVR